MILENSERSLLIIDEDRKYDYGFFDTNENSKIDSMWIDRNNNGIVEKRELRKLSGEIAWATFPSSLKITSTETAKGITYFIDYTDDDLIDEIARDIDKDGDIEVSALAYTDTGTHEVGHYVRLTDTDNDGDFDRGEFKFTADDDPDHIRTSTIRFPKPIQNQITAQDDWDTPVV